MRRSPTESANHHIHHRPLTARPDESVAAVRARLRRRAAQWDLLCVVDGAGRLLGTLTPQALAALHDEVPLQRAMDTGGPTVAPEADQEQTASLALQLAAFVLFRFFDAAKPGPVGWADRRFEGPPGRPVGWWQAFGILFDDLVAAGCTLIVVAVGVQLWTW